ncbi:hypothetical protein [Pseudomonas jilinensis]|uniref:Uncharacterized protein n=1 Tax=Pseudomonas jilinensis TaxID=2078689 RepID=A0A396S195_9PSED|nr:hypothetical protein [Pseudomonas jilinensis]RHW22639.1 hypothetical protein C2846_03145 [Pseudomonas jilinensis]
MEILTLIVVGGILVFFVLIVLGHAKGAPKPESMSIEAILGRIQSEEAWIRRYKSLPFSNQQGSGIKKQYEGKKLYIMELQLEFMRRGLVAQGKDIEKETMVPIMRRAIELMRSGMDEDAAQSQASAEYIEKRDAGKSQQEPE